MQQFTTKELIERERAEMRSIEANLPKCPGCGGIHRDASALCWGCQREKQ